MMQFGDFVFRRDGREYGVTIGWDEGRLGDGVIDFKVLAFRRNEGGKDNLAVESHISVEVDKQKGLLLKVKIADGEVISQPLSELFEEESVIGRALETIPSFVYGGDPILGCLIRAGCSATVGQIVICKDETVQVTQAWDRALAIGRCLRQNIPDMLTRAMLRAVRCIFRAGF